MGIGEERLFRVEHFYDTVLRSMQGLFLASESVERKEFEDFVVDMTNSSAQNSVTAFIYAERVPKNDLQKFINTMKGDTSLFPDGYPDFTVVPVADKEEYYPIIYVEPIDSTNIKALGLDISSIYPEAIAQARDKNLPSATKIFLGPVLGESTIVSILPIYMNGLPHETPEDRQKNIKGIVGLVFRTKELFGNIFASEAAPNGFVEADVFEGDKTTSESLIFNSGEEEEKKGYTPAFVSQTTYLFAGKTLTVRYHSKKAFDEFIGRRMGPAIVLVSGFLIDLLLVFGILVLFGSRNRAMKLAKDMTADIEEKSRNLQKVNRALKTINDASQITIKTSEEGELLKQACKVLVDVGGYRLVWIGYEEKTDKFIKPKAWAGYDEGYLEKTVALAEKENLPDPFLSTVKEKRVVIIPDLEQDPNFKPWLAEATQRGYKSVIAAPLLTGETVLGTMAIYSSEVGSFTFEEISLLEELSRSLSYGVINIRDKKEKELIRVALQDAAEELKKKNRALLTISEANQVTIKAKDEKTLIKEVCDVLVKNAGYRMVWVGYAENDEEKSIKPVAWAGYVDGYVGKINASWADTERGRGPTGTAIREKKTVITPDFAQDPNFKPWLEDSKNMGYVGSVVVPFFSDEEVFGAINIYTSEMNLFSSDQTKMLEEIKMLEELAGDLSYSILNIRNKEEKEKIDASLRRTAEELSQFRLAVDNASDHIIITDPKGTILYANKGAEHITGYSHDEIMGKNPRLWGGQMPKEFYQKMWQTLSKEKQPFVGKLQNKRKSGELYEAMSSVTPILDDAGNIIYYVGVERDITRDVEIDRSKSEFVSLASHQLRTPLSAINWYAEMLLGGDAGKLSAKQKDYTDEIYASSKRMSDLVGALLNVSRIELGTFAVEPKPTNVAEISDSCIQETQSKISSKHQFIEKKYAKDIPIINVDPNLTRVIFQNLISNAVKYTPDGGKITIALERADGHFKLSISDTGYGIPAHQQEKVFSKFFRADNIIPIETDGTGLGLYIVKEMLDKIGGSVSFESEENKGTTFSVSMPLSGMPKKEGTRSLT